MSDRFKIGQITALELKPDESGNSFSIRMIYRAFYVILTIDNETQAKKWFNSL